MQVRGEAVRIGTDQGQTFILVNKQKFVVLFQGAHRVFRQTGSKDLDKFPARACAPVQARQMLQDQFRVARDRRQRIASRFLCRQIMGNVAAAENIKATGMQRSCLLATSQHEPPALVPGQEHEAAMPQPLVVCIARGHDGQRPVFIVHNKDAHWLYGCWHGFVCPLVENVMRTDPRIQFCVLGPQHAAELARLEAGVFADAWSKDHLAGLLREERFLAVGGFSAQGLQCYLTAYSLDVELEIVNVAVAESWRGQGVGSGLLEFFLRHVQARGGERIFLEVRSGNEAALRLYRRGGFMQVGQRKGYYRDTNEDALILEWSPCPG